MRLEDAIAAVKAAGYRVSKPREKKQSMRGPTCVVTFADGEKCRMSTYSPKGFDWARGINLCRAAWSTRKDFPMAQAPKVLSATFERDGALLATWEG